MITDRATIDCATPENDRRFCYCCYLDLCEKIRRAKDFRRICLEKIEAKKSNNLFNTTQLTFICKLSFAHKTKTELSTLKASNLDCLKVLFDPKRTNKESSSKVTSWENPLLFHPRPEYNIQKAPQNLAQGYVFKHLSGVGGPVVCWSFLSLFH